MSDQKLERRLGRMERSHKDRFTRFLWLLCILALSMSSCQMARFSSNAEEITAAVKLMYLEKQIESMGIGSPMGSTFPRYKREGAEQ